MKFTVQWHPAHTLQVRNMNPWVAEAICKAVHVAAESGKGTIRRVRADDPFRIKIYSSGAVVYAAVDPHALTLTVLRIVAGS